MSTEFFNDQWRIPSNENQNKISNYCMHFDGTSASINVGQSLNIYSSQSRTISCWFNINSFATTPAGDGSNLLGYGTSGSLQAFSLAVTKYVNNPNHRLYLHVWNNTYDISGTTQILENNWYLATVTYDGSTLKLYLDGNLEGSSSTSSLNTTTSDFIIGQGILGTWNTLNGQIDQVSIFDYALSPIQVASLGLDGYAFNFSGSNQYVNYGNSNDFSFSTNTTNDLPFSFSGWVKPDNTLKFRFIRKAPFNTGVGWEYLITTNSSGLLTFLIYSDASNRIGRRGSTAITSTDWQHWAFTYDGTGKSTGTNSGMKIYINGVEFSSYDNVGSGTYTGMTSGSEPLLSGITWGSPGFTYADGEMSNVSIFNTELSSTQVSTIYNSGKPGNISSLNPVGWWKLDDTATFNSGTSVWTIPDDSSNSNNGTSVGMNASSLVASNINGELIANPMITSPKPIAYYQLGDQSAYNGSNYLVPNNSLSDYNLKWVKNNSSYNAGDSINIPGINKALAGATSMSMTFWVYLDPAVYPNGVVFRMNNSPGYMSFSFVRYGNSRGPVWMFSMSDGTNSSGPAGSKNVVRKPNFYNSDFVSSPTGGSNIWWNITCTWDGSTMKVYRNAVTQSSRWGTYTGTIPSSTNATAFLGATKVGSNSSVANELFLNGRLSNVAFWRNYTLTQDEATEVYNNGAPLDLNSFSGAAPEAWYKLDSSEIFNNASTEWSVDNNAYPSVYKSSLNFNGNDYINCGTGSRFNIDQITISAWVKRNSSIGNYAVAAGVRNTNNGPSPYIINLSTASSKLIKFVITQSNSTGIIVNSNTLIEDDIWYHVVGVADGSNVLIYVNGDLQTDQKTYDGTIISPTQNFNIGRQPSASTYYWNGELSNVAVFDTGLSLSQVETLYNNGTPEASISHSPLSWWKLDNTTTGIQDSAGSNDGTSNGATEYAGFVNSLAGESSNMDSSNLVVSDLQQTSGYSPYALSLDGINDVLTIQNSSTFNLGTAFAISGWFNFSSNKYQGLISFDATSGGSPRGWFLFQIPTNNEIRFFDGTNTRTLKTSYTTTNQWDSFIITYDGTDLVFYINGNQESTQAVSVDLQTNGNDGQIGNNQYASGRFFDGKVSNIALWNVGLSSTQVTEIYNEGVPSNLHNFSGTAPVSWWQLGSNSSYLADPNPNPPNVIGRWTCLDEVGTNNAESSNNMTNDAITDGPGYSASGVGNSSIDIKGDAPYSTANGLSENMDVLDRTTDVPS